VFRISRAELRCKLSPVAGDVASRRCFLNIAITYQLWKSGFLIKNELTRCSRAAKSSGSGACLIDHSSNRMIAAAIASGIQMRVRRRRRFLRLDGPFLNPFGTLRRRPASRCANRGCWRFRRQHLILVKNGLQRRPVRPSRRRLRSRNRNLRASGRGGGMA
jgi:hypothetical protein